MPRTRGGLPPSIDPAQRLIAFAPHTRGSTVLLNSMDVAYLVCPAHAGVYLGLLHLLPSRNGLPRTRGGLPHVDTWAVVSDLFAPHTRGSTESPWIVNFRHSVCPAHAGVYRATTGARWSNRCLPRTRGGLPSRAPTSRELYQFAPHTRGSTCGKAGRNPGHAVCPAHAGVYRFLVLQKHGLRGLPRTRGGLPYLGKVSSKVLEFAPHTRGSTFVINDNDSPDTVCPAHAGVYRAPETRQWPSASLPRTRGGLPQRRTTRCII